MSRFQPYDENVKYIGTFGIGDNRQRYECGCIEQAVAGDDAIGIAECVERGWLTKDMRTFGENTVVEKADYLGRIKVAAKLRELGFA